MSVLFTRSVVIPSSFIAGATAAALVPGVDIRFSLFLLVLGLAVSTMIEVLWHAPPVALAASTGPGRLTASR